MTLFITLILVCAFILSFMKLALLNRIYEIVAALLLMPCAWLFQRQLASTSLQQLHGALSNINTLNNWCTVLVIQELILLIAAASLLGAYSSGHKGKWWSYVVFMPSLLLIPGSLWLKLHAFNYFLKLEFRTITLIIMFVLPLAALLICELTRLLCAKKEAMIENLLQFELFFLLLGIFLPVAAQSEIHDVQVSSVAWQDSLITVGLLVAVAILGAVIKKIYRIIKPYRIKNFGDKL